ncbi:unnamed protein product [Cuscuta epithymum]|uniref:FRIGIDA-like protein n=1 Tax=Cuscuta epithymum TaxID=186058 RepID=A0AAV0G0E3_9ASTE|nr:unnamed protein product [Cuscuta epithymum]
MVNPRQVHPDAQNIGIVSMSSASMPFSYLSARTVNGRKPLLSTHITASSSISEVVDFLTSSFLPRDFDLGKKILIDRENALKSELEGLKSADKSALKERDLEILNIRGELEKYKRENEDLTEKNIQLTRKIEELDGEKKEYVEKFAQLGAKVNRLEEDFNASKGRDIPTLTSIEEYLDGELPTEEEGLNFGTQKLEPNAARVSPKKGESHVVVLSDSDDELPTDSPSNCRKKMKYDKEAMHEAKLVAPVFCSPKKPKASKGSRKWLSESEMRLAFANDGELCMRAICALYRKLLSAPLTLEAVDKGFEPNDQIGVELAKYLIDGNPENKLNRSMLEASPVAIGQSKRLARQYSEQLFRIYSSGEDPLFCHNSIHPGCSAL